jgi:hypothetical protein
MKPPPQGVDAIGIISSKAPSLASILRQGPMGSSLACRSERVSLRQVTSEGLRTGGDPG